jgi:hypothetical protein
MTDVSQRIEEMDRAFVEAPLESLPAEKRNTYNHARKSRIFAIDLKDRKPIKS